MKIKKLLTITFLFLFSITPVSAESFFQNDQKNNTIIELFTSQGCSSCPPAEKWLGQFKDDERLWKSVFPVAFHVDYWDYIGWKDIYAKPAFSQRQKQYKAEKVLSSVYTPGFVVNGNEWRGWFGLFSDKKLPETRTQGKLSVSYSDNRVKADYQNDNLSARELNLNIAILATGIKTKVKSGENAGRVLPQDFTVMQFQTDNSSSGYWKMSFAEINRNDEARVALVAWVTKTDSQKPLQVTGGWIK